VTLLWSVEGFGRVLLSTTCLPDRPEPYNLNLELTRGRLMQIINKREDWSIFEDAEDTAALYGDIQDLFIKAIQEIADGPAASQLADQALQKAMTFSESLAAKHAKLLFTTRGKNHGFGRGCLGCWVDPKQVANPAYLEQLAGIFGLAMVPFNWGHIELERGKYDFSKLDACITMLSKRKLAIGAGPLLCFTKEYLPKWLLESPPDFEKIREYAYEFVSAAAARYGGMVRTWCVVSGLNAFNHFGFGFEQVLEITRAANRAVKAAPFVSIASTMPSPCIERPNNVPPMRISSASWPPVKLVARVKSTGATCVAEGPSRRKAPSSRTGAYCPAVGNPITSTRSPIRNAAFPGLNILTAPDPSWMQRNRPGW